MAKKKKYENLKLEQTELTPIVIGSFGSKKKSSIGIFIILTLFVLVVLFLPEISSKINSFLNPTPSTPSTPKPIDPGREEPGVEDPDELQFYAFSNDLKIENEEVAVNNFVLDPEKHTLSYDIVNRSDKYQDIETLNYFLEIYTSEKALIERIKLAYDAGLQSGAYKNYVKDISSDASQNIGYLVLIKKNITDYPAVELAKGEDQSSSLVCSNANEKVTYKFLDDKLKSLSHEYRYLNTNLDYQDVYVNAKTLSNTYNNRTGITSTFFDNESGFNISTVVDLENASRSYVFKADTFKLDTEPKVVKFEMEAQNFKCN